MIVTHNSDQLTQRLTLSHDTDDTIRGIRTYMYRYVYLAVQVGVHCVHYDAPRTSDVCMPPLLPHHSATSQKIYILTRRAGTSFIAENNREKHESQCDHAKLFRVMFGSFYRYAERNLREDMTSHGSKPRTVKWRKMLPRTTAP